MAVEIVEPAFPLAAKRLKPVVNQLQGEGLETSRPPLRVPATFDEARFLEHLQMLRDRRLSEGERLHQLADSSLAAGQSRNDGAARHIAKRRKRDTQLLLLSVRFHSEQAI